LSYDFSTRKQGKIGKDCNKKLPRQRMSFIFKKINLQVSTKKNELADSATISGKLGR
jgi:hypothetical protein